MKILETLNKSRLQYLRHIEEAKTYAMGIFFRSLIKKYNPAILPTWRWMGPLHGSNFMKWLSWPSSVTWDVPQLNPKEQAKWDYLLKNMIDAKMKYEEAGGDYLD